MNSLRSKNKQHELQSFVDEHKLDLLLMVETKLKEKQKFHLPNYEMLRNDRTTDAGGGTAILIKSKFTHMHLECLSNIK